MERVNTSKVFILMLLFGFVVITSCYTVVVEPGRHRYVTVREEYVPEEEYVYEEEYLPEEEYLLEEEYYTNATKIYNFYYYDPFMTYDPFWDFGYYPHYSLRPFGPWDYYYCPAYYSSYGFSMGINFGFSWSRGYYPGPYFGFNYHNYGYYGGYYGNYYPYYDNYGGYSEYLSYYKKRDFSKRGETTRNTTVATESRVIRRETSSTASRTSSGSTSLS
ncbi:hypothetical protein AMJ80_08370, partial [bacterium SM23_31]